VVHDARLAIPGAAAAPAAAELLSRPGEHRVIVRFSRAVGVPRPIPDPLGLSLRVPDVYGDGRHQDFLLVTSADYPVAHHIFLPALDVQLPTPRRFPTARAPTSSSSARCPGATRRGPTGMTSSTASRWLRPPVGSRST
jgi:hypothetical protein